MAKYESSEEFADALTAAFSAKNGTMLNLIRANRKTLNECEKHDFGAIVVKPYHRDQKVCCRNCGGVMPTLEAIQYARGYKAAGGNPNDVIRDFE